VLAHRLVVAGVGPDRRVGLCAERSLELVIGVLAILKAGGAYVPLDPGHPDDRRAWIIADSGARVVLASRDLAPAGTDATVIVLDDEPLAAQPDVPPAVDVAPDHVAYIIYTSGSTG
jgi:non-ribosomal peptide synthetase component F